MARQYPHAMDPVELRPRAIEEALAQSYLDAMAASDGDRFLDFWEAAVRAELRADPQLLD